MLDILQSIFKQDKSHLQKSKSKSASEVELRTNQVITPRFNAKPMPVKLQ